MIKHINKLAQSSKRYYSFIENIVKQYSVNSYVID